MRISAAVAGRRPPLFLPLVWRMAGHLEQIPWSDLAGDPAAAAFALRSAQRLFGLEAVLAHFRLGVEAEACGADRSRDQHGVPGVLTRPGDPAAVSGACGRAPLAEVLAAGQALAGELADDADVVGVVTGPRTLARLFGGAVDLDQLYGEVTRAWAEAGVRALLVVEEPVLPDSAAAVGTDGDLVSLVNVARFFRLPALLLDPARLEPSPAVDVTFGPGMDTVAVDALAAPPPVDPLGGAGPVVTTAWEVPPLLPPERLAAWVDATRAPS